MKKILYIITIMIAGFMLWIFSIYYQKGTIETWLPLLIVTYSVSLLASTPNKILEEPI